MADHDYSDLSSVHDADSFLRLVDEGERWDTCQSDAAEVKRDVLMAMDSLDASLEEKVIFLALALRHNYRRDSSRLPPFGLPPGVVQASSLQSVARALLKSFDEQGPLATLALFREGPDFPRTIAAMANQLLADPDLQVDRRQFAFDQQPAPTPSDPGTARPAWEFFLQDALQMAANTLPPGQPDILPPGYHPARSEFRSDAFPGRVPPGYSQSAPNRRDLTGLQLVAMGQPEREQLNQFQGNWLNLRAEAVLYFGDEPYNLRRLNSSCNGDYAGDEAALAAEIQQVPLLQECPDGTLQRSTSSQRPQTCAQVAGQLAYHRLPWSDEGEIGPKHLQALHHLQLTGPVLITCHQGKARSSLAMTALALQRLGAHSAPDLEHLPAWGELGHAYRAPLQGSSCSRPGEQTLPAWLQAHQNQIRQQKARRLAERFALLSCYAQFLGSGQSDFAQHSQPALYQRQRHLMLEHLGGSL